jgi:hypothetical protein
MFYTYLYINCILITWHPGDGHKSAWNMLVNDDDDDDVIEHIYKCAFFGSSYNAL